VKPPRAFPWGLVAAVVSAGSFLVAALTLAGMRRDLDGLRDRARTAADLAALEAEAAALRRWQGVAEQRAAAAGPADLSPLAKAYLPADGYRLATRPGKPLPEAGWSWVETEVTFSGVEFERLSKFLARAESEPLPWELTRLSCEAVTATAATGTLTLRRLELSGAEPNEL
jgi:hypothetical protein